MAVRAIAGIAALLLVCLKAKAVDTYTCSRNQLAACDNSPRLNISKSGNFYYLQIPMCSNDQCVAADVPEIVDAIKWVNCNRICEDCNNVLEATGVEQDCGGNDRVCETTLDSILNSFCKNITLATPTTCPFVALNQSSQTITVSPTHSQPVPKESPLSLSSSLETTAQTTKTIIALGTLLGLSMVLLAVVTTGWVCTCLVMKKGEVINGPTYTGMAELNDNNRSINEQQLFPNPAYTAIHTPTHEIELTYDYVNFPSQPVADRSGQAQDVVNKEQGVAQQHAEVSEDLSTKQDNEDYI